MKPNRVARSYGSLCAQGDVAGNGAFREQLGYRVLKKKGNEPPQQLAVAQSHAWWSCQAASGKGAGKGGGEKLT